MRLLCSTKGMTREDWLEVRRQGIVGSDAHCRVLHEPMGLSLRRFGSKTGVWMSWTYPRMNPSIGARN